MSKKNDKDLGSIYTNRFTTLSGGKKKVVGESTDQKKFTSQKSYKSQNEQFTPVTQTKTKKVIPDPEFAKNNYEDDDDSDLSRKISKLENNQSKKESNSQEVNGDDDKTHYLNSQWTVWVHRNDCEAWTVESYKNIYLIDSIESFWEFFNVFHKINKEENQYFIMRNKIKPIWEDNNNRHGGICSLKINCYDKNGKIDVGSELMTCLCILIMNETFIKENNEINGISYAVKNKSIYIKIWTKDLKNDIEEKLPKNLMIKFNNVIRNNMFKRFDENISIKYTPINPEYEDREC
jgi:hypothetical protein